MLTDTEITDRAINSLARILRLDNGSVSGRLEKSFVHNWATDPYSRGAYSYVGVGGLEAMEQLAAPVSSTLFFAGEATESRGYHGTVHGAIATGYRAAKEILQSLSISQPQLPRTG